MSVENDFNPWLKWAVELQAISQNGLAYVKDVYDNERYERIREISAEMLSYKTNIPVETVKELFCNEAGYQTPKIETRAAIFSGDKILLVKESGKWSLPGGWVDVNESVYSNTIKEVREEAGLEVKPLRLIAVHDKKKHSQNNHAFGICSIFVLCELIGGCFKENIETTESGYFPLDSLPELYENKNSTEQIKMCFQAKSDNNWKVQFD